MSLDVAVITGSLRKVSFSRRMGLAAIELAPPELALSIVEIGDLPHYNEDLEADPPEAFTKFRTRIAAAAAVLFVTPEFNRSIPGLLKTAVDCGSRPWGKSVWSRKPAAVISTSIGAIGGFGANHHLRQVLAAVGVATMPHPESYIGHTGSLFDDAGKLTDVKTREFVASIMRAFAIWIDQLRK